MPLEDRLRRVAPSLGWDDTLGSFHECLRRRRPHPVHVFLVFQDDAKGIIDRAIRKRI